MRAAGVLGRLRGAGAVSALAAALDGPPQVARAAFDALIAHGSPASRSALIPCLARGEFDAIEIARLLVAHPDQAAVPLLNAALRAVPNPTERVFLKRALAACRNGRSP